jgi:hypothetical protein
VSALGRDRNLTRQRRYVAIERGRIFGFKEDYPCRLVEIGGSSEKGSELPKVRC